MYGREKSEVVKPTNAVSVTRNTLSGSTKNCPRQTSIGPVGDDVGGEPARGDEGREAEAAAFASGALSRSPSDASSSAPASGMPSRMTRALHVIVLQLLEVVDVEAVELLADLEEEDAEDEVPQRARRARCRARPPSACRRWRWWRRRTGRSPSRGSRSPAAPPCARVIIIRNGQQDRSRARCRASTRVIERRSCEIGAARLKAKITSPMPTSIVVGMLISVSMSLLRSSGGSAGAEHVGEEDHLEHHGQDRREIEVAGSVT